ncbi:mucin-3A isoform X4 [Fundulus heteroclitus]|nr:mucin-3A isoform X4 [Fundulus heteroclitus]
MNNMYKMVPHFQGVIVTSLSPGGSAIIANPTMKEARRSVEAEAFHYAARTDGINVTHDVVLEIPNNYSVQLYGNSFEAVKKVIKSLENCTSDFNYTITHATFAKTELDRQAVCEKTLENTDFAEYYTFYDDGDGRIICINRCDKRHNDNKICKNGGNCTLYRDLGEVCKCHNVDSIWYLGSDCDMPIHKTPFYAGLSVTLAAMLILVGALAAYAVINKRKQKKKKDIKQKLVNEWLDDDYQWTRSTSPVTHGAKEPLVCGARLDVCDGTLPGLSETLCRSGTVTVRRLVEPAGPDFSNIQALGSLLGVRSDRLIRRFLDRVKERMTAKERHLLQLHYTGHCEPDPIDPFPDVQLDPDFTEDSGPLLYNVAPKMTLCSASPQMLYKVNVKIMNKRTLRNRPVSVCRDKLGGQRPQWRILYKPPVRKWTGDLQWRILHGAIATNSFLSIISPGVLNVCPFCGLSESVFHVFMECVRLMGFFSLLTRCFSLFGVVFTNAVFINGVHYSRATKAKSQMLNFLIAEAKMAIYISRRDKLQAGHHLDAVALWKCNVKARVRLEFHFHRATQNMDDFMQLWGFNKILCGVSKEGELQFNKLLI